MFPLYDVLFFIFSIVVIVAAVMVIVSRNPVRAVLFLVLVFFAMAVLWMMLQAEFLALLLIFVYVGAVMTLFLFVVMMLNIELFKQNEHLIRYLLPLGFAILIILVAALSIAINPHHFKWVDAVFKSAAAGYSNVTMIGIDLYTHYVYAFEIAGVILLVAIIAAITLAFHGRKSNVRRQSISKQLDRQKKESLRMVKMKASRGPSS